MARLKLLAAMALVVLLAEGRMLAASELPPDSIGPDTFFVIHADARHLTPALLRAAFFTVLGDNVDRVKDFSAKFQGRYDLVTKAGLDSITIVGTSKQRVSDAENEVGVDPNADAARRRRPLNPPVIYYHLKPGADAKAIQDAMTLDMPDKQKQDIQFERMDDWIVQHEKNQTPPEKVDADRAKAFDDALATAKESAVTVIFICDDRTRMEMGNAAKRDASPKFIKSAFPLLSECKWITVSATLGNNPSLNASANAADVNAAHQLRRVIDNGLDDLKEQVTNPNGGGPMMLIGPVIAPLLDGLRPIGSGAVVSMSLKGDALTSVANLWVTFRMNAAPPPGEPGAATRPAR